jgi:hypothetical protein
LKKIIFIVFVYLLNFSVVDTANAQEWKRYQEFTIALGNQFSAPMRTVPNPQATDSFDVMGCTSEPIDPYVVVTAAHCIWGIYGDKKNNYAYNGGVIWIQEPGKRADDPTAKRVKVISVIRPDSIGNSVDFPVGKAESQDDIAFLVLEKPIVTEVKHKIATLEQIKFALQSGLKMRVYGYGLNSVAEQDAYYATPQELRYNVSNQLDPRKLEYDFVTEALPSGYTHHVGLPKMVMARSPICGALGTSGSPAVIEINGEEFLIGPGSHSTGWNCPELKNHNEYEAKNNPFYKYRNISSHIVIANYPELLKKAIDLGNFQEKIILEADLKAKQELDAKTVVVVSPVEKITATTIVLKKSTIVCIKGKVTRKVTSVNPICPKGYKK